MTEPATSETGSRSHWLLLLLVAALIGLSAWNYSAGALRPPPTNFDDSYMYARYAQHLLAGDGMASNPGGEQTYGTSSVPYLMIFTGLRAATAASDAFLLRSLSVSFGLAAVLLMVLTAWRFSKAPSTGRNLALWAGLIAPAVLTDSLFVYHSRTGTDTTLSMFLNALLVFVTLRMVARATPRSTLPVILVSLQGHLPLARPLETPTATVTY